MIKLDQYHYQDPYFTNTKIRALNGEDGSLLWEGGSPEGNSPSHAFTLADASGDGLPDILLWTYGYRTDYLNVLSGEDGSDLWGTWYNDNNSYLSAPSVGDLDGDGGLEIIYGGDIYLLAFGAVSGEEIWTLNDFVSSWGTPVLGDIDGDGRLEIVLGGGTPDSGSGFSALNGEDGSFLWSYPFNGPSDSTVTPLLGDINGDGRLEIVVTGDDDLLYAYGLYTPVPDKALLPWPMLSHDPQLTNCYQENPPDESVCSDGDDNDGDGLTDCLDPGCEGRLCGYFNRICLEGACLCTGGEDRETTCSDGLDNDCDGLVDCLDPSCKARACTDLGQECSGAACSCPQGDVEYCDDGLDNDCDGLVDCFDQDCCDEAGYCATTVTCAPVMADCDRLVPGFCYIPPGTFLMGSPKEELGRSKDEDALHQVTITRGFFMKATEVTIAEWQEESFRVPDYLYCPEANCPIDYLTWWEALEYCNARSDSEGLKRCYMLERCVGTPGNDEECADVVFSGLECEGYRLPTEGEWEYATRGGTTTAFYTGDASRVECHLDPNLDRAAWYCGNGYLCHEVAQKEPNPWGLFDTLGNNSEWVWDWHGPYLPGPLSDPLGPDQGSERVLRGGGGNSDARECRAASREKAQPSYDGWGFRPVRTE